jgi:hypothetical protein
VHTKSSMQVCRPETPPLLHARRWASRSAHAVTAMAIHADMRKYHLLTANCQMFALDMVHYMRSNAATFTKPPTHISYVERFCHQLQITPLHAFGPIAASIAVSLLLCGISSLTIGLPWWSLDSGRVGITKFMRSVRCVLMMVAHVQHPIVGGCTNIGTCFFRNSNVRLQLLRGLFALNLMVIVKIDSNNWTMVAFEAAMAIANFLAIRLTNRLIVSANPKLDSRTQSLGVQAPNDRYQRSRHSLGDKGDETETHSEHHLRSSRAGQSMDCPETVLALSECAIRHSMASHNSTARAQHDATHSGADKYFGIAHKPVRCGQPEKIRSSHLELAIAAPTPWKSLRRVRNLFRSKQT